MHPVQTLLPLYDPAGDRFDRSAFDCIAHELSERSLAEQTFAQDELVVRSQEIKRLWLRHPGNRLPGNCKGRSVLWTH